MLIYGASTYSIKRLGSRTYVTVCLFHQLIQICSNAVPNRTLSVLVLHTMVYVSLQFYA